MIASTTYFLTIAFACLLAPSALSANIAVHRRRPEIVVNPQILTPNSRDIWSQGEIRNVTWKTSDIPTEYASANSTLYLGYLPRKSKTGNEHLKWKLASNFTLGAGKVSFTVPTNAKPRDDYIVVLLGDSGNRSPRFSIQKNVASVTPTSLIATGSKTTPEREPSNTLILATLRPGKVLARSKASTDNAIRAPPSRPNPATRLLPETSTALITPPHIEKPVNHFP